VHLKLFDIKAEVGVGLEVPAVVKAQAFAHIQGTLALKVGPVQRSGPVPKLLTTQEQESLGFRFGERPTSPWPKAS